MPTGVQLRDLVSELRAEVGHSQNVAQGVNMLETLKHMLRRTQRNLWNQHNWLGLSLHATVMTVAGQRYYAYPGELDYSRVEDVNIRWGSIWTPITKDITTQEYTVFDSQVGVVSDPVQRWDHVEYEILPPGQTGNPSSIDPYTVRHMLEFWPIPASAYQIRLKGRMSLLPLVEDNDICTLDSDLIVMFAAAQILARQKSEDAGLMKGDAVALLNKFKAQQNKNRIISMSGADESACLPYGRPGIDFMP